MKKLAELTIGEKKALVFDITHEIQVMINYSISAHEEYSVNPYSVEQIEKGNSKKKMAGLAEMRLREALNTILEIE